MDVIPLDEALRTFVETELGSVNAVGAIPWARERDDAEFASISRQAIAWLRLELSA